MSSQNTIYGSQTFNEQSTTSIFDGVSEEQLALYQKTVLFLKQHILSASVDEGEKRYRLTHTLRVAALGQIIARAEGLDETALILGCLLHDVGKYACENGMDHGRASQKIARPFLTSLGLDGNVVEDVLYGIAIHVDGKADYEHPTSVLAESISDCDNIDRFDVYRIYEMMKYDSFELLSFSEQLAWLEARIKRLHQLHDTYEMATPTATSLFRANIEKQLPFFEAVLKQMKTTGFLNLVDLLG